jgi:hypothetical protein
LTDPAPADRDRPGSVHQQMVTGAHLREGWDALGTMLSAMLVFGLPSWWVSEAFDQVWVMPVGLVLGMAAAIATIWVRYGVPGPEQHPSCPSARARSGPQARTHPKNSLTEAE